MHQVAVLAAREFHPFDLGIPCEVFRYVPLPDGQQAYEVTVCGEQKEVRTRAFTLHAPAGLRKLAKADTVIIPGIEDPAQGVSPAVISAIQRAWKNGARIASICSGAFVLADTGLLNGRRATTHWHAAAEFALRYPQIQVDEDALYIDEGRIITSAGAAAGLDMCLHLVRRDHGASVAADAARLSVTALERSGGQKQFIRHEPPGLSASFSPLLEWMHENISKDLNVKVLAARANVSPRTFARRFREQTGTTPMQWVLRTRARRAQELLETTSNSVEQIARAVGFTNAITFRSRFRQCVGVSPSHYRAQYRSDTEA